jgi:hypothetical protein
MLVRLAALAAFALVLTACAAATPGYVPPPLKSSHKGKFGTVAESGKLDDEGAYALSENEKALDCKRMTGSMQITIARLRDSARRPETSELASDAHKTIAPVFGGSTIGADRRAEFAREKAKLEAYNRQLASKGCKTVDVEAELARAPEGTRKY